MVDRKINSEEVYLRLIEEEYSNQLSRTDNKTEDNIKNFKDEFAFKVKQIVLEENRQPLDLQVDVITSAELKIGLNSGYDGTALYLHSKEDNIQELYIISQGSQNIKDWEYNAKSMLAGLNIDQAQSTNDFITSIKDLYNIMESTPIIGLSHSLAHNNNLTAHLLYNSFDEIYSVNGAQTNYYQLISVDSKFKEKIRRRFSIPLTSDENFIYDLDPKELHDFAQEYYKDKIPVVNQRISTDDPLYALNTARGFFQLGNVEYIDTNPDYPGLHSIMSKLPDDIVKDIQSIAIDYTTAANLNGTNAGIKEITGIDFDLIKSESKVEFAQNTPELYHMVNDILDKLPRLLSTLHYLVDHSDSILQELVDANYITHDQKNKLNKELTLIGVNLSKINRDIEVLQKHPKIIDKFNNIKEVGSSVTTLVISLWGLWRNVKRLNTPEIQELLGIIKSGHDIPQILEALNNGNKSYLGTDMVLTSSKKGKEIKVNISAALRMYRECKIINEDQHSEVKKLQEKVDYEIKEEYATQVTKVLKEVRNMEENPSSYDYLLRKHVTGETWNKQITKINVQEYIGPLQCVQELDGAIDTLRKKLDEQLWLVEDYRKIIESLFDAEERISLLFNEIGGI